MKVFKSSEEKRDEALSEARTALTENDLDRARKALEKARKADAGHVETLLLLGYVYDDRGEYDASLDSFKQAVVADPGNAEAGNMLGLLYARQERYNLAVLAFRAALEQHSEDAQLHNNLGNVYYNLGLYYEAMTEFQIAQNIDPSYGGSYHHLGIEAFTGGRYEEALAQFEQALSERKNVVKTHVDLGRLYARRELWERAASEFRAALEIEPSHADAHQELGEACARLGRFDEAILEYEKLIQLRPHSAIAQNTLGLYYDRRGLTDLALEHYRAAAKMDAAYAYAHFVLAQLFESKGKPDRAVAEYLRHVRIDPIAPLVADAKERIQLLTGIEYSEEMNIAQPPPVVTDGAVDGIPTRLPSDAESRAAGQLERLYAPAPTPPPEQDIDVVPPAALVDRPFAEAPAPVQIPEPDRTPDPVVRTPSEPAALDEPSDASAPGEDADDAGAPKYRIIHEEEKLANLKKASEAQKAEAESPEPSAEAPRLRITHGDGHVLAGGRTVGLPPPEKTVEAAPPAEEEPATGPRPFKIIRPGSPQVPVVPAGEGTGGGEGGSTFKIVRQPKLLPYEESDSEVAKKEAPAEPPAEGGFKIVRKQTYFPPAAPQKKSESE